jgi:hypothetical protein
VKSKTKQDKPLYSGPFHDVPDGEMIVVNSWEEVPRFSSEEEEADFWDTHTLADHLWSKKRGPKPGSVAKRLVQQRQKSKT